MKGNIMARAVNSTTITMGLVSIPVKIYNTAKPEKVGFCQLTQDLHRVKQQWLDATTSKVVVSPFKKGYEYIKGTKGAYGSVIEVTDEELETLAPKGTSKTIEIKEFIKTDSRSALDALIETEKVFYLSPGPGGEQGYSLLALTMRNKNVIALAQWTIRGRIQLVAIRAYANMLLLQQLYYSNEIVKSSEIKVPLSNFSREELTLAEQFVDNMIVKYDPFKYKNDYMSKLSALIDKKLNGEIIKTSSKDEPSKEGALSLIDLLTKSLKTLKASLFV